MIQRTAANYQISRALCWYLTDELRTGSKEGHGVSRARLELSGLLSTALSPGVVSGVLRAPKSSASRHQASRSLVGKRREDRESELKSRFEVMGLPGLRSTRRTKPAGLVQVDYCGVGSRMYVCTLMVCGLDKLSGISSQCVGKGSAEALRRASHRRWAGISSGYGVAGRSRMGAAVPG